MPVLKNAELFWAKLDPAKPVEPFGNLQWEIQVRTRDMDEAKRWKNELNLNVKKDSDDDGTLYRANLKKKAVNQKGEPLPPVTVVDAQMQPLDGTIIGNGSVGNVQIRQREYDVAGNTGVSTQLFAVQVTQLKEFKAAAATLEFDILDTPTEVTASKELTDTEAPAEAGEMEDDDDIF